MGSFDWVAVIGAAAWLPQIVSFVHRMLIKPRMSIIPVPQLEIGYTFLGPILNIKAALFAENKDATIVDMHVLLTHEKGRSIRLNWHSFVEKFSELRSLSGETAEVSRDQEATALRISTSLPVEKFIRFQDPAFQAQSRELTTIADADLNRITDAGGDGGSFVHTKAYSELTRFLRHQFCWEAGRYQAEFQIQLLERRSPVMARSEFSLAESDVERLALNVGSMEKRIQQIAEGVPEAERVNPTNWANPHLGSKRIMVRR
jgi:hypothetical protein